MKHTAVMHSGTLSAAPSLREQLNGSLARKLAAEGMVLLKNDGLLPLPLTLPIALLGSGASRTVKGGTGSGDVNNRENITVYDGLKEAGMSIVSEGWLEAYDADYDAAREAWKELVLEETKKVENPFDAYACNPFAYPQGPEITDEHISGAEAIVYVISRISGEGKDRRLEKGDYYLSEKEEKDLRWLNTRNIPVVLLLNTGGPVELTDILEEIKNIRAVLQISQPGQEGGRAVADVLLGKTVPSGKLTATWAKRYEQYPCASSFGYLNGDVTKDEYREGIFVGYRYFDRCALEPLFPFGFGLSYTKFSMEPQGVFAVEDGLKIKVKVTNTGDTFSGREVVQIYASMPQTGEEKELQRLIGFEKTPEIAPGESCEVTVFAEQKNLAVFSEKEQAWIVEAGRYGISVGCHSRCVQPAAFVRVDETTVLEKTTNSRPVSVSEMEIPKGDSFFWWMDSALGKSVQEITFIPKKEEKWTYAVEPLKDIPAEDLLPLLYGNITQGTSTLGSSGVRVPGSAGETSEALEEKYGIRSLIMADGPAGLRLRQHYQVNRENDSVYGAGVLASLENGFLEKEEEHEDADTYYQYCTAFPIGTALAQSWDRELLREFGRAIAVEMQEFHVDLWLAPGMNIQRNPLCGRNFEYYSEDPLVAGEVAAAVTQGVQSQKGCGVTIKHMACNNQEDNRMGVDARISERTLREIYLRGFEIAVKKSSPAAIMSSYNLINGVHAANDYQLCTQIARKEWGFAGLIMSDWNTTCFDNCSTPWKCAAAGNDIIMPGNSNDDENIRKAFADGMLTEEIVRECAGRIFALVRRLDEM